MPIHYTALRTGILYHHQSAHYTVSPFISRIGEADGRKDCRKPLVRLMRSRLMRVDRDIA